MAGERSTRNDKFHMFCVFKFYIIPYSYYNFIVSDKVTKKDLPTAKKIKKKHLELLRISLKNCNFAASLKKNAMEFTGKIIAILQPRGGVAKSGNEWKAQEYVIEDHGDRKSTRLNSSHPSSSRMPSSA